MRCRRSFLLLVSLVGWAGCSSSSDEPDAKVAVAEGRPDSEFLSDDDIAADPAAANTEEARSCLGETHQAEVVGLDIFLMLDTSASMTDPLPSATRLASAQTKWDAVKQSLEAFVQAPESADIGVGLQYFPQLNEGVPFGCATNDECGIGGPCSSAVCVRGYVATDPTGAAPPIAFLGPADPDCMGDDCLCASDADCRGGASCQGMTGVCSTPGQGAPNLDVLPLCGRQADCAGIPGTVCEGISVCANSSPDDPVFCLPSLGCPPGGGACIPFPFSCLNQTICEASSYAVPAVPITNGPARAAPIIASLEAVALNGLTPTAPALRGALEHARAWGVQHPGRQVVTVLATDGLPTECAPTDIPSIARLATDANGGSNPVRTFVIGVFSAADLGTTGRADLDRLAREGGSERAFVINTGGNVADEFLKALNEIRDTAISCDFQLDAQAALDFDRVNLKITDPTGTSADLANVGGASACGSDQGWYYTLSPEGSPAQIRVCPSTCTRLATAGVTAELEIGCATRIR